MHLDQTYFYLIDDGNTDKKAKSTKKFVIKRILKFNDYQNCLMNNKVILKSQQRFKSELHDVYTEEINKIAQVVMMIRYCTLLIELHLILMVQVLEKYAKQRY